MFKFITVGSVFAFAKANSSVNQEMVDAIRSSNALWEATEVSENIFANYTDDELSNLLGTEILPPDSPILEGFANHEVTGRPPNKFDSRNAWPDCIHEIRDQ